ncbi:LexA family transcriptional regulator [Pseudomonas sp. AOB-7]|uniref:XRE family transcriptional regulator n=1 Tax=Pseudomonas sp. AOB-7 TaxID=2482750 RepID=UPI000EFAC5C8|nr:LexA family transcriptional regulator [Pseudomonas sp. AOB-7]RMH85204.1 LexA family transcriptional regulator [Pseudomonas sp. AOB-7]
MESLGKRIARLRRAKGLSQTALAAACGWDNGQARIGNYEHDKREPSISDLRILAAALDTTLIELLDDNSPDQAADHPGTYGYTPSAQDYALVPQYTAHGAAGNGQLNDHVEVKGGLVFKRAWLSRMSLRERNLHVIYVQGHSMEPTVCDGDVVLLDESQTTPRDGRVYAIRKPDGELIIKRLIQSLTGGWLIRSDNEDKRAYPDQPVTDSDIGQLSIVGRVVWHGGAL